MPHIKRENKIAFNTESKTLDKNNVQMCVVLLDKSMQPMVANNPSQSFDFEKDALPFDVHKYWEKRPRNESYFVLMSKVAYLLPVAPSYFSEERLSSLNYLGKTMPDYKLTKVGTNKFKIACGFMAPDFGYELNFLNDKKKEKGEKGQSLLDHVLSLNPELGEPSQAVMQHNYDYSRVLLHKTSKMSLSISLYYPYEKGQTLAVNYTLNYIHELPPNFMGGANMLLKEIEQGICSHIANTRRVVSSERKKI